MTALLSKIDANLLQLSRQAVAENVIDLHLDGENNVQQRSKPSSLVDSIYANTIELSNNECISYHLSLKCDTLTLYPMGNPVSGKTINIHLPSSSMNKQHTLTVQEIDEKIIISVILQNGVYLIMELPFEFVFSDSGLGQDWFKVLDPYDFTIRIPHLLYDISLELSIVFLDDGGLLGLKKTNDSDLEPILFNDNSYLQSISHIFSRKSKKYEKAISCLVFQESFLVVLTQNCHLKVWDLNTFNLLQDYDLSKEHYFENTNSRAYENPGRFFTLLDNWLVIYLPFGNGIFQIGSLTIDNKGNICFTKKSIIPANLSSSSIWSLVDMTLLKPLELNKESSYLNLAVLWKSGSISKLQILNLVDEDLQAHEWIDATNKSLSDIESEQDLNVNGDVQRGLLNLKSRYAPQIFDGAQQILSENNIVILAGEPETEDYVANLDTVLRDLKNQCDEVSSLSVYRDEIIVVNCLQKYNHSVYKINSTLENIYYNIHNEINEDELSRYLKTLHGFSTTLSKRVLTNVSEKFVDLVSGKISKSLSPNEKFTEVFKSCLESKFEVSNLKLLFEELNSFNVIPLLNDLISNHLLVFTAHTNDFIDAITLDNFTTVITIESLYQLITIQRHFILQVLLTFALLDFDYEMFANQLDSLLELHFKQSLVLELYRVDKSLVATELFVHTTKFRSGIQLNSYSELFSYLNYALCSIYGSPVVANPYFMKFFDSYVLQYGNNQNQDSTSKLLLENIGWPFYIREDKMQEFMLAMMLFVCKRHGQAYEFFQLNDYPEAIADSLPTCLKGLQDSESTSIWAPLLSSFSVPYRHSAYNYELSLLFARSNNAEFAYKCIKKSIEYSMKNIEVEEPHKFKQVQLKEYLDLLFNFCMYVEALDVLRFSHATLSEEVRTNYYRTILESTHQSRQFFATLLKLCHSHEVDSLYLPVSDFQIIDNILSSHLRDKTWESFKKLYSFRMVNKHERSAAEILYDYLGIVGNDIESKRKCYLIIINVLSTFDNERDQWLLNGSNIITLPELRSGLQSI